MQYKTMNLKFTIKLLLILLTLSNSIFAQQKIDGVAAVVGEYVVLESDIEKTFIELKSQGVAVENFSRCNVMGKLLEDKLYAHNAVQDSIVVSNDEVESRLNQQIDYMKSQLRGDINKVLEYYKKDDEVTFRKELFDLIKTNLLASEMKKKIVSDVEVSPEEVYSFFKEIPENERPTFGAELKISQIIIKPQVPQAEIDKVIDKLKQFKADVIENGASFASKAVLYSKDEGSRPTGGKYTINRKKPKFVKEFREAAFSLDEGEISEPFKTEFGYHILMVDQIRGQEVDVRHILLKPETSNVNLVEAKKLADTIRKRILDKEITFQKAALEFSDEKETKFDGGKLRNPETYDHNFELTKMDPSLYSQVINLQENLVSNPILEYDGSGNAFYKLILITDKKEEHVAEYGKDFLKIKDLATNNKQIEVIGEWQKEKIKDTYIKINGEYRDCEFTNNWLKK